MQWYVNCNFDCWLTLSRGYKARVIECKPTMDAREATCAAEQQRSGVTFIPPYNARAIIAGQGTIALEFLRQVRLRLALEQDPFWRCLCMFGPAGPKQLQQYRCRWVVIIGVKCILQSPLCFT